MCVEVPIVRLFHATLLTAAIAAGCATPDTMHRVSARGLAGAQLGMTEADVRESVGKPGEPIFKFAGDHDYVCRKFVSGDNGVPYYFLWEDGKLASVMSGADCKLLERTSGADGGGGGLPHEHEFAELLAPFNPPRAPETLDFAEDSPYFQSKADRAKQTRAELLMWSPIIVLSLPFLPLTAPAEAYDDAATAAAYARAYRIEPGMDGARIEKLIGKPDHILGDMASYGVYTYHYRPADGESMYISIGWRNGKSEWIRFRYNAFTEYVGPNGSKD